MSEVQSDKISSLAVKIADAAATLPVPTVAPSAAILAAFALWKSGAYTPKFATIAIDASGAGSITGGTVHIWDATLSKLRTIALLNGGTDVTLTATMGFEQRFNDLGIFDAAIVSGTIVGGINVTINVTPVGTKE